MNILGSFPLLRKIYISYPRLKWRPTSINSYSMTIRKSTAPLNISTYQCARSPLVHDQMRRVYVSLIPDVALFLCILVAGSFKASGIGDVGGHRGIPLWAREAGFEDLTKRRSHVGRDQHSEWALPMFEDHARQENWKRNGAGFEPYANNGGTVVAVAGEDFCIIAADTRLSDGYSILSRNVSRVHRLSGSTHLATAGCWADTQGLLRMLRYLIVDYELEQRRPMGTRTLSRMLSTRLYYRRGFPFYTFNVVAGLDEEGSGAVYAYDAVGSFERVRVACAGGGLSILQPVLDRLEAAPAKKAERENVERPVVAVGLDEALALVRRAFIAGGERDISLGDSAEIFVITKDGQWRETLVLKSH